MQDSPANKLRTLYTIIQNDGPLSESFFVRGTASNRDFRVRYLNGASDITPSVVAGTYRTGALTPQGTKLLTVEITAKTGTSGRTLNVGITATPVTDATGADRANLRVSSTP